MHRIQSLQAIWRDVFNKISIFKVETNYQLIRICNQKHPTAPQFKPSFHYLWINATPWWQHNGVNRKPIKVFIHLGTKTEFTNHFFFCDTSLLNNVWTDITKKNGGTFRRTRRLVCCIFHKTILKVSIFLINL